MPYIVMTSAAKMPTSVKALYRNVAIVEWDGINKPKQIHPNHKAVLSIPYFWGKLFVGKTNKCAYTKRLCEAHTTAEIMNSGDNEQS